MTATSERTPASASDCLRPAQWFNKPVTVTLEQTQSELLRLIKLAQRGEEVVITSHGHPVAKLTGLPQPRTVTDRRAWLARLVALRQRLATGKSSPTVEQILDEDRGE